MTDHNAMDHAVLVLTVPGSVLSTLYLLAHLNTHGNTLPKVAIIIPTLQTRKWRQRGYVACRGHNASTRESQGVGLQIHNHYSKLQIVNVLFFV